MKSDVDVDRGLAESTYIFIEDVSFDVDKPGETSFCVDLINKNGITDSKSNENIAKFIIEKMERAYWQGYFACQDKNGIIDDNI